MCECTEAVSAFEAFGRSALEHEDASAFIGWSARADRSGRWQPPRVGPPIGAAEAVEVWNGLACGSWSLVHQVDCGAERYLLARRSASPPGDAPLTPRQRQVLECASLGMSNKTISYDLGMSATTVSSHLSSAARRLGVSTRVEALQAFRATHQGERSPHAAPTHVPAPPAGLSVRGVVAPDRSMLLVGFPRPSSVELTAAEVAILVGVLKGQSDGAIAAERGTAVRTVSNQVSAMLAKLAVGSRAELASRWLELLSRKPSPARR